MLKQYSILTMCQLELKDSRLPVIENLRIEIQLIQTKQLLLQGNVSARIKGDAGSESRFMELHDRIRHACSPEGGVGEVESLILHMLQIKEDLGQDQEPVHDC